MTVSVIIPNFNGAHWLRLLLPKLKDSGHQIIVVDGGSTDNSFELCMEHGAQCVLLDGNPGFPAACNEGVNFADGELLLFLNNDTELLRDDAIDLLAACMEAHADIGIVGAAGAYFTPGFGCAGEVDGKVFVAAGPKAQPLDYVPFWCAMVRKELYVELGGLNLEFGMGYSEDADFAIRLSERGYRLHCMDCGIKHLGGGGQTATGMGVSNSALAAHCGQNIERMKQMRRLPRILVIRLDARGDILMTAPAVKALRKQYPQATIDWLVKEACADYVRMCDAADRILLFGRPETERILADTRYDLLYNFNDYPIELRVNVRAYGERVFGSYVITQDVQEDDGSTAESLVFHNRVWKVGKMLCTQRQWHANTARVKIPSEIPPISKRFITAALPSDLPLDELAHLKLVAMHGSCGSGDAKLMPRELFYEIAAALLKRGFTPLVLGAAGEDEVFVKDCTGMGEVVDLVRRTRDIELPAVLGRCVGFIGTDSVVRHVAVGVGIPTVCIFTMADQVSCGSYGRGHVDIQAQVPCSPCWNVECDQLGRARLQCWKSIDAQRVVGEFLALMGQNGDK